LGVVVVVVRERLIVGKEIVIPREAGEGEIERRGGGESTKSRRESVESWEMRMGMLVVCCYGQRRWWRGTSLRGGEMGEGRKLDRGRRGSVGRTRE
jgi:hypothetical protein